MKDEEFEQLKKEIAERCSDLYQKGWSMHSLYELAKILNPELTDDQAAVIVEVARACEETGEIMKKKGERIVSWVERGEADASR